MPKDGEWGALRNGKWTGLIKDILDNNADIIVAPISWKGGRNEAVQFLHGIKSSG